MGPVSPLHSIPTDLGRGVRFHATDRHSNHVPFHHCSSVYVLLDRQVSARWYRLHHSTIRGFRCSLADTFHGRYSSTRLWHAVLANRRMFSSDPQSPRLRNRPPTALVGMTLLPIRLRIMSFSCWSHCLYRRAQRRSDRFRRCLMQDHVGPMLFAAAAIIAYLVVCRLWLSLTFGSTQSPLRHLRQVWGPPSRSAQRRLRERRGAYEAIRAC